MHNHRAWGREKSSLEASVCVLLPCAFCPMAGDTEHTLHSATKMASLLCHVFIQGSPLETQHSNNWWHGHPFPVKNCNSKFQMGKRLSINPTIFSNYQDLVTYRYHPRNNKHVPRSGSQTPSKSHPSQQSLLKSTPTEHSTEVFPSTFFCIYAIFLRQVNALKRPIILTRRCWINWDRVFWKISRKLILYKWTFIEFYP